MGSTGGNFNAHLVLGETENAVSQAVIASASNVPGYTVNTAGVGSIVLTRRYVPTWAIVVAIVGALFFLIGLLALLIKETETLTLTLSPVKGGTKVLMSGIATPEMVNRITSALKAMRALDTGTAVDEPEPAVSDDSAVTKTCPDCAETVKAAARVCRFCGHKFSAEVQSNDA